jgi:hypothetical protein
MAPEEPEHGLTRHASTVEEQDEAGLAGFGYKQELKREWGMLHNFGISFSIIVRGSLSALISSESPSLTICAVCHHRYHNTFSIWTCHWWPGGHGSWMDYRLTIHNVCCARYG